MVHPLESCRRNPSIILGTYQVIALYFLPQTLQDSPDQQQKKLVALSRAYKFFLVDSGPLIQKWIQILRNLKFMQFDESRSRKIIQNSFQGLTRADANVGPWSLHFTTLAVELHLLWLQVLWLAPSLLFSHTGPFWLFLALAFVTASALTAVPPNLLVANSFPLCRSQHYCHVFREVFLTHSKVELHPTTASAPPLPGILLIIIF